jgi:hypothetical protein
MIIKVAKTNAPIAMSMSHPLVLANRLDRPQLETVRLLPAQRGRAVL